MTREPDRDPPPSSRPAAFDPLDRPAAELAALLFAAHRPRARRSVRARHGRQVALKVVDAAVGAAVGRQRFLQEIQLAARLLHPHILPVFDSGESGGRLWYAMPYVAGESLRHRLAREPRLPIAEAVRPGSMKRWGRSSDRARTRPGPLSEPTHRLGPPTDRTRSS